MYTSADVRPRRSALYVPGDNKRAIEKAKHLPADVLIIDLEDSVAPEAKVAARKQICDALTGLKDDQREIAVRVNALDTSWHTDDLHNISKLQPAAIVIPKVNSAEDVIAVESDLNAAGADSRIQIWAVLETCRGVLTSSQIASCSPRLTTLVMGTNDLACELHAEYIPGRQPLLFALSQCLLAARAAGKIIFDGVFNDLSDAAGFEAECSHGRSLGFDGKTLIHPSQIDICNRVFSPTAAEIERASKIIAAFNIAQSQGKGVTTFDGRMIENLHVEEAAIAEPLQVNPKNSPFKPMTRRKFRYADDQLPSSGL